MSQFTASVVIPVWNQWQLTKACLETLRPTLGVHDEVIVVDNGSEDGTAAGLKQFPWVTVIKNEVNRGFAIACNQGAAVAHNDVVVFLNNDTLLPNRWLEGLLTPFADLSIFATGPRSNMVSGPQLIEEVPYGLGSMSELRRFAKQWRQDHRGETTETIRLVGFCIAVRNEIFRQIGGFDEGFETGGAEDDDLCVRLMQAGGRLLICHESFVHHHGHATFTGNGLDWFAIQKENISRLHAKHGVKSTTRDSSRPLLSACMIIKDEADILESCLTSLSGLVDEVVIYDTGSTDGSIELARANGARVIEGYWDDDFSRARNASLDECVGEWAMHIDADEIFEGKASGIRNTLEVSPFSAYQIEIVNLGGSEKDTMTHRPARVFKRDIYHWSGRLHEQLTMRDGRPRGDFGILEGGHLVHYGYTPEIMAKKDKAARNIRIAELDAEDGTGRDPVDKLANLGRSYTLAGRFEEAIAVYNQARALQSDSPVVWRMLYRSAAQACLTVNRPADALTWADDLARTSEQQDTAHYLRGVAHANLEQWQESLDELKHLTPVMKDDDGTIFPYYVVQISRAASYGGLDMWEKAADEITPVAKLESQDEQIWRLVAEAYWRCGRDLDELVGAIPAKHMNSIFAQIVSATPAAADAMLESLVKFEDRRASVLATAIRVAPHLDNERAAAWSVRLRAAGLDQHCPLLAKAANNSADIIDRFTAAGLAFGAFGDQNAVEVIKQPAAIMPVEKFGEVLQTLDQLAPQLLEHFIVAAANNDSRSFAMARALHELGATEEAVAVIEFGLQNTSNRRVADDAAAWLDRNGHQEAAQRVRSQV